MANSIKSQLLRVKNEFNHIKVDTLCKKTFEHSFHHLGRVIGPFKIGHPYQLDQYIARIFVEQGYLQFEEKGLLNSNTIQKINFQESTNPGIGKIQDKIYVQALEQLKILSKLEENEPKSRREYRKLISDVNDLIRVRLAKITRLANQSRDMRTKKKLSAEELILFESISTQINDWRDILSKID
jgi:GINS complex protein helical bundle domain